ncbi:hypothetical protein VNO78_21140 [Psophocarpus tetragonolobus]|uniref:Uncharacterized protein n=1 Tax=Psophocarpus tetragonolobus TaxID=3891 RepID=A0AAN9SB77_PSOTE
MILEKWQRNVTTSIESWSLREGKPFNRSPTSLFATSSLKSANLFLSHRAERTFGTLLIAFLGYAIDGRISSGSPLLAEMNGSEGGAGFYFRAGREVKAIREDCPPGKEEKKRVLSSNLSRPVSRGVENPDRLRESLALFSPSFRHSKGVYSTHSPVFRTAQVSVRLRMRTSFPSAHSPFTRFSKQRRKGGQQVPRALCPTHLSRSKCSSPVPPNAPISRQRSCECAVMLRMLRHRIDRPSSRSFPVHSLYISDTQGRTRWVGSSPSLCPADHSAGILHSRLRLTAARGWSCRYVSLSGSLAPPVMSFYDMLLSSPYSICNLVISASLRVSTSERKETEDFIHPPSRVGAGRSFDQIPLKTGKSLPFPSNDPAPPGSSTAQAPFPTYAMLPRHRPTTLRACGVFAGRSLPVVPSSPLAVWAGCPSLLRSVVMITPGYALAPLTGTPGPANAHENPGRAVRLSCSTAP